MIKINTKKAKNTKNSFRKSTKLSTAHNAQCNKTVATITQSHQKTSAEKNIECKERKPPHKAVKKFFNVIELNLRKDTDRLSDRRRQAVWDSVLGTLLAECLSELN